MTKRTLTVEGATLHLTIVDDQIMVGYQCPIQNKVILIGVLYECKDAGWLVEGDGNKVYPILTPALKRVMALYNQDNNKQ